MGLRLPELLIILFVVILVFGANKIPQLGDALGKGIRNFKKASETDDSIDVTPKAGEQPKMTEGSASSQASAQSAQRKA